MTNDELRQLTAVLNARAYAVQTQLNTATIEGAMDRLLAALEEADLIQIEGRPAGSDGVVWQEFETAFVRARQMFLSAEDYIRAEASWTIEEGPGSEFTEPNIFQPREPTTSGTPDFIPDPSGGGDKVLTTTTTVTDYRTSLPPTLPAAPWYTNPVYVGGAAAGLVALWFLAKK